jgi:hypothetical protein
VVSEQNNEFKVVDKRAASGATDEKPRETSQKGDGFVMKETPSAADSGPDKIDFSTFIFSLATGAFIHLGLAPDPASGQMQKDLAMAKQDIELLALIWEKTKGNLTDEESKLCEGLLAEVRLRFVEASKSKA